MASRATTIPFSGGQDTTVDKHLAGLSKFRSVINGRLDADGRLVSRPGYTALPVTAYGSGNHVAYDLFDLDGRLCSLGDRRGDGHPTDVFEYVEGAAAAWKPSGTTSATDVPRLPRGTRLVEIARPPDQKGGVSSFDIATCGGFILLTYNDDDGPPLGSAMIMKAASGQPLLFTSFDGVLANHPRQNLQAVALTSRFWAIGFTTNTQNVTGRRIDAATQEDWQPGATVLLNNAAGFSIMVADKVGGVDQFVVATVSATSSLVVRRYDAAGTLLVPSGGQYAAIAAVNGQYIAVEADSTANQLTVAVVNGATLQLYSWNLSTGAQIGAPPFVPAEVATETCTNVTLVRVSSTQIRVLASVTTIGTPDVPRVFRWVYTVATGSTGTGVGYIGLLLASGAVYLPTNDTVVFGATTDEALTGNGGQTPNMLIEIGPTADVVAPVAAKDLGFAAPPLAGLPKLATDTSRTPTRYYWAHAVQSADGASIPVVCELALTDPGRRQVARVGRGVVISGALPCWYDSAQIVELGMIERPRIVSLVSTNGAGSLASGGTYSYILTRSWFDTLGRLHRSPISLPVDITLGGSDDTVTAVGDGPHTARHNRGSAPLGSVVRSELYRTRAIVTNTAASIVGDQNVSPPVSSLLGLTILIFTFDGTTGAQSTVTFGAATTQALILAAINAVAAGRYLATNAAGGVAITGTSLGGTTYIQINGNASALATLGFSDGQSSTGTTEIERGEVFHQTAVSYTVVGGASGDRVTFTDTRDDTASATGIESQSILYTQLESPLDDCSPLPADRVWSGLERVELAGHPQRETWSSSKLLEQGFAPAWAQQGRPGFSGELVERIEAVLTHGLSKIYLTRKALWQVNGEGPALNGRGTFSAAQRISNDGGLVEDGWRSLLETAHGTWMQLGSDKLYLMAPGAAPVWAGFPIRELLRQFPVISAAALTNNDQVAAFALQNAAGTAGCLALLDLRRSVWFVDQVPTVPVALADYQGRLCWSDTAGVVYMQDLAAGVGTFVPLTVDTAHAMLFGTAGQGGVQHLFLVGTLLGDCTLELKVDYDDGAGFVTVGTFPLTVAAIGLGQTVREEFDLALEDCSQFAVRVLVTGTSGSAGLALVALEVHAERDAGPALLGDSFRR